ncbi:PREDICTED: uncharacterized protein LOC107069055 [Polistes dominula]|uniref:Uncharacterized protein LOC107069055 n=1 Tax=Polistes dominula TaxID=743375 RepID=A0ABM1IMP9_POLDO|nr:PREDICTED: uncharacterized protein LOC107069055 [Polistes dominula]XP_015181486.1 PREDICTED: uncharacterized protein LOC107069055 [Polistes dominula]
MSNLNDVFHSYLRTKTGKYSKCWLAATLSTKKFQQKFRSQTVNEINVSEICDDIKNMNITMNIRRSNKEILYTSFQLMYGATKIHSYQVSNLEKDIIELEKMLNKASDKRDNENDKHDSLNVLTPYSEQLHENFKLLPHELDINTKLQNLMHEAECLEFGALTEQELNFLNRPNEEISTEMFERIHITDVNDKSLYYANTLRESEEFYIPYEKAEKEMILQVRDELIMDGEEYYETLSKMPLPEITANEFVPEEGTHSITRKRQPTVQEQIETPTKKRRLKFEDIIFPSNVEITLPEVDAVPVALERITETLEDLESISDISQQSKSKSKKVRVFADKNTQLSHKVIRKCINNVRVSTVPLKIFDVNTLTLELLFQEVPARFLSIRKNKWNSPLNNLFYTHNLIPPTRVDTLMEYELEKPTFETMRLETKDNKTQELSELSGLIPETKKSMKETIADEIKTSQLEIAISEINHQTNIQNIEQDFEMLNIVEYDVPDVTMHEKGIDQPLETSKYKDSHLTKTELLALLEVLWHDSEMVKFTDLISPESYNKFDASRSFLLLLELHQENKIILEQATPYDILWIKKCYNNDSD